MGKPLLSAIVLSYLLAARGLQLQSSGKRRMTRDLLELNYASPTAMLEDTRHSKMQRALGQFARVTAKKSFKPSIGLTRTEEVEYSNRIRTYRAAIKVRDQSGKKTCGVYVHPTEDEWAKACGVTVAELRRILYEGQEARAALVAANIGLVTSVAKRHHNAVKQKLQSYGGVGTILTMQDMIQEGNLGLMEAAERYEPEKGFRFSTYATYWVRQRILRSINDTSRTIRLPEHVHTTLSKINKARREIKVQLGRDPAEEEIAQHLEMSVDKLRKYASSSRNVLSLESPLRSASSKEDTRTIGDTIASDAPTPEEDAEADLLRNEIRVVMDTELGESEREVIVKRFGLEDGKPRTVAETGKLLSLSPDRVRSLEARALNKLRHPQRNYRLKKYVEKESAPKKNVAPPPVETASPERVWFF